jgi:hypothetical protein
MWRALARYAGALTNEVEAARAFRCVPEQVTAVLPGRAGDYGYYLQLIAGSGWSSLPWLRFLAPNR